MPYPYAFCSVVSTDYNQIFLKRELMCSQKVKILNTQTLHQGFIKLVRYQLQYRLFRGGWSPELSRELVQHPGAVAVLPYDPKRQQIVLLEQFRVGMLAHESDPWLLEIVAGVFDGDEQPEQVARREAQEEAGLSVETLTPITQMYTSPGISNEKVWLYCGIVDSSHVPEYAGLASESEDIKLHVVSVEEAFAWLDQGKINNAIAIVCLQWLRLKLGNT
jgi:ADP-ribose pyrophosphatase